MTLFGLTVGRNETSRYLAPMLAHAGTYLDWHFFYDDQSADDTASVAAQSGCVVEVRPSCVASFREDEGVFREAAWNAFEETLGPKEGDWVLVIDCDEVLVSSHGVDGPTLRNVLNRVTGVAAGYLAVCLDFPEVFGFDSSGVPLVRVDRLWGTIHAPRLFKYLPNGVYAHGEVGVPAVPSYVMTRFWSGTDELKVMHYGYAHPADQAVKYERYSGRPGHSSSHVESIVAEDKVLVPWEGPYVTAMGGS